MADAIAAMKAYPDAAAFYARFRGWLARARRGPEPDDVLGRPERGIVLIPRLLQPEAERVADRFAFVGPVLDGARLGAERGRRRRRRPRRLRRARHRVHRAAGVLPRLRGGVRRRRRHVVLAIGEHVDPAALGPLGHGVEVHPRAPQLGVLAHADVFITHAGMGSATEALWFGVPTVASRRPSTSSPTRSGWSRSDSAARSPTPEDPAAIRADAEAVAGDGALRARLAAARDEVRAERRRGPRRRRRGGHLPPAALSTGGWAAR